METASALQSSLLSPMTLAFVLGVVAALLRSDLKFPEALTSTLTIYLLFAIGLKGGSKLQGVAFGDFVLPAFFALLSCIAVPLIGFWVLRKLGGLGKDDSAAVAAHYGSVSVVTFSAAIAYLDAGEISHEPFMPAILAMMEVPAIMVGIWLAGGQTEPSAGRKRGNEVFAELLTGKSVVLLVGGMIVGFFSGSEGVVQTAPLFEDPFKGVLTLFLLEAGLVAGRRFGDLRKAGLFMFGFGIVIPFINGVVGAGAGLLAGLSPGGATVMATLFASASYIAAPAAVRAAIPKANPALYLAPPLALTFPFNVVIGIPVYHWVSETLAAALQ